MTKHVGDKNWSSKDQALAAIEILKREVVDYPWSAVGAESWLKKIWLVDGSKDYVAPHNFVPLVEVSHSNENFPIFCPTASRMQYVKIDGEDIRIALWFQPFPYADDWLGETQVVWSAG